MKNIQRKTACRILTHPAPPVQSHPTPASRSHLPTATPYSHDPPAPFPLLNFLAHLYLAEPTAESLLGNLMGDFVKGTPASLAGHHPPGIIRGIRQHRAIDVFTDSHPTFAIARSLLPPTRRRLAGIVVDVLYDYILSNSWPGGHPARSQFIDLCHDTLLKNPTLLGPRLRAALPHMISEQWLESYSTISGLALTFRRISTRAPVAAAVLGAENDLLQSQSAFEDLFTTFFPELQNFSHAWLRANP